MIGVNTFCLRRQMGTQGPALIEKLRDMGYDAIEPFVHSEAALAAVKKETDRLGMAISSIHVVFYGMEATREALVPYFRKLHEGYGVDAFVISGHIKEAEDARRWAGLLKDLADELKEDGCRIVYHNHDSEIRNIDVDGKQITALDYFFEMAGPDVLLQLDIGWAGLYDDEVAVTKRYAERIHSLHLKDFHPGFRGKYTCTNIPQESFCPIGCGEIRCKETVALRNRMSNFSGSIVIDQDNSAGDIMEDLKTGVENVRAWL